MSWAISTKNIAGQDKSKPLILTPGEALTYNLELATYKNKYTNEIIVDGTTAKATVLLPKVAENKNCTLEVSQSAGTGGYAEFKYQTAEQSGASVLQLSAAQLNATLYCNGETWIVIKKAATNVNS